MAKLLVIVGPTAVGKSSLAIQLAQQCNGEIICADSQTIYKGFDIGTAKPSKADQSLVAHYGLDLVEAKEPFSAYNFKKYANKIIAQIETREKQPILVGGSGLYIDSVLFDYQFRNNDDNLDFKDITLDELVKLARGRYPSETEMVNTKNRRRLEQLITRGPAPKRDLSQLKKPAIVIGLDPGLAIIKENIVMRIQEMLSNGFIQEVENLRLKFNGQTDIIDSIGIGYKYMNLYLDGKLSRPELCQKFAHDDYMLARRQLTWFRANPHVVWFADDSKARDYAIKELASALQ